MCAPAASACSSARATPASVPPRSSRLKRGVAARRRARRPGSILPAPGNPMISTTSPSAAGAATTAPGGEPPAERASSARRASSSSTIRAARAALTAVSTVRRSRQRHDHRRQAAQPRERDLGRRRLVARRDRRQRRIGGQAAAPARARRAGGARAPVMPRSRHSATRPPRSGRRAWAPSSTSTASIVDDRQRLLELGARPTLTSPTRPATPSSTSRASARTLVASGVRGSTACSRYRSSAPPPSRARLRPRRRREVAARPSGDPATTRPGQAALGHDRDAARAPRATAAISRSLWPTSCSSWQ